MGALLDATGFEPATSPSRTVRSTKLSHASKYNIDISEKMIECQGESE